MGPAQVAQVVCTLAVLRGCEHVQYVALAGGGSQPSGAQAALIISPTCTGGPSFPQPLVMPANYTSGRKSAYPPEKTWQYVDTLFVADLRQGGALADLKKKMDSWEQMSRLPWLLIVDVASQQEALRHLTWRLDNKVIFLVLEESGASFSEAYRTEATAPPVVTQLGAVDTSSLRPLEGGELAKDPWNRRLNLTGALLRCAVVNYDTLSFATLNPNGSIDVSGMSGDIFHALQSSLNFRLRCHRPTENSFGITPNSGYTEGILGEVFHDRADAGLPYLFRILDRDFDFDFTVSVKTVSYSLAIKKSKYFLGSSTYTLEFDNSTWIAIVVMFVANVFILKVIMKNCRDRKDVTLAHCCISNVALFCNMGPESSMSRSPSYRLWLITVLVAVILLHVSYSSSLITLLTSDEMKLPFKDLKGLHEARDEYSLSIEKGTSIERMFKTEKEGLLARIYRDMMVDHPEYTEDFNSSLKRLLRQPKHLVFYPYVLPLTDCRIAVFQQKLFVYPIAFPFRLKQQMLPIVNIQMMKIRSSGIMQRLMKRWNVGYRSKYCGRQPVTSLGVQETVTAFYVLAVGLLASAGILLLEAVVARLEARKKSRQPRATGGVAGREVVWHSMKI